MSFSTEAKKIDRFFRERSKLLKVNFDTVNFQTVQTGTAGGPGSFLAVDSNKNLILSSPASSTSFNDDVKVFFGNDSDAFIEYNEDGDDFFVISGSAAGIVLSGSTIQIDGTLEGASPLRIGGEVQFVSSGESVAFNFGPNNESKIFFGSDNFLTLSGSHTNGSVISGSTLSVQTTNGIGVGVSGDNITHAITLPNNDNASGQIKANAFIATSSRRYKKEIKILDDPMDTLNKIEGVSFKWKDSDRLDYGFIAEDVGKILPNIVSWENNKRDAYGMDYLKIISFLVEAVKNQQKEINKLKQTVK
tara:strand:+ start:397 stop:1308 length:912 start_codon:yes stop_codon:yes gene_type:complete